MTADFLGPAGKVMTRAAILANMFTEVLRAVDACVNKN